MNNIGDYDFDPDLPSPLEALRRLRADARDAVVALGAQTSSQLATYVPGLLDDAILKLASARPRPHAIFITGSAGGGKSGAAEYQRQSNPGLFEDIVEDATHADGPTRDQAELLASRLSALGDDALERPSRPILVAANIGMIVQLASAWSKRGLPYAGLTARLFDSLGLPGGPNSPIEIADLDVQVLNLDDRPTAGPSGLLEGMLPLLRPAASGTAFHDGRCTTCAAIAYCPARANAQMLASFAAVPINELAARAAIGRGREDTPRALWDFLSRIALPDSHYNNDEDPCMASQRAYRRADGWWVASGLLPLTVFTAGGDLGNRVAELDPAREPSRAAYEAFAGAGLLEADDAEPLHRLAEHTTDRSRAGAVPTAAFALAAGLPPDGRDLEWRDTVARLRLGTELLLGGPIPQTMEADRRFIHALGVYTHWQRLEAAGQNFDALIDAMEEHLGAVRRDLARGLARLFGETIDDKTFLPVQNYDPRAASKAFVEFDLEVHGVEPLLDRPTRVNSVGAALMGYRPLAVSLRLPGRMTINIDLPIYRLIADAAAGLAAGSGDAERTFALRRAAEAIARSAAQDKDVAMLVTDPATSRRYQVTSHLGIGGRTNLRARVVSE